MKIGYRKCFNLGNYENEVIFIEGEVPDGDDFAPVFENMKNAVEDLHRRSLEIDAERAESEKRKEGAAEGEGRESLLRLREVREVRYADVQQGQVLPV